MKPKRVPWPRRKKTLVWSLTAALLVVVLMAGHFLCFTPGQAIRAAESHAGTGPTQVVMEGAVGNVPLYLSQNHRAWMVTPFRLGLFYDWRNNGQPLMVIDRSGDPPGHSTSGTATAISPSSTFSAMWTCPAPPPWWPAAPIRPRPPSTPLWNSPPPSPRPERPPATSGRPSPSLGAPPISIQIS